MPQLPQPFDEAPALADARAWVARCLEPCEAGEGFYGLPPLHPQAGHRTVRAMLKEYALYHPLNMTEVCTWARAGADDAEIALIELIAETLDRGEPLPPVLAAYNLELIHPNRPRRATGPKKVKHCIQDIAITALVILVIDEHGLSATRRQSLKPSACSVVAEALAERGIRRGGEKAIEKIWQRYSPAVAPHHSYYRRLRNPQNA